MRAAVEETAGRVAGRRRRRVRDRARRTVRTPRRGGGGRRAARDAAVSGGGGPGGAPAALPGKLAPRPRWTSWSTSATTPCSRPRPWSNSPAPKGSSASRTAGDLDLMQRIVSAVRSEIPGHLPGLQRAADRRADGARVPGHRHHAVLVGGLLRTRDRPGVPRRHHAATTRRRTGCWTAHRPFVDLRAQGRGYAVSWSRWACGCGAGRG